MGKMACSKRYCGYLYMNDLGQYLTSKGYNRIRNQRSYHSNHCTTRRLSHAKTFTMFHHDPWPLTHQDICAFKLRKLFYLTYEPESDERPWVGDILGVEGEEERYEILGVDLEPEMEAFLLTCTPVIE